MRRAAALFAVIVSALSIGPSGCARKTVDDAESSASSGGASHAAEEAIDPKGLPLPQEPTAAVRVYTTEPGFAVFVDGEPVRDSKSELLLTPCEVVAPRGRRLLTVAKEGFRDATQDPTVGKNDEVVFLSDAADKADETISILKADYIDAPLADPLPLLTLNTPYAEQDPFLGEDGLSIWFVSDRPAGKGIYVATRPSPFHAFGAPRHLAVTRSPDRLASPSVTASGLLLVYAVPEKARLSAILRTSLEADFGNPKAVQFAQGGGFWPSAQVTGDGLQVFWTQAAEEGKPQETMTATRRKLDQPFSGTAAARLPGGHACLAADGLRQYVFDGKLLRRSRRTATAGPFSALEVIASLDLPNYVPSKSRRQFCVSNDEQWLVYSDNPDEGGDLHMVRLVKGRGWGVAARGKSIPPRQVDVAKSEEPSGGDSPETKPAAPEVDPRTLPIPYAALREKFVALMAERKYDEAEKLVNDALTDAKLADDAGPLRWDLEDVARVRGFWQTVRESLRKLKPGAQLRIGASKLELVKFEEDVVTAKSKSKNFEKPIQEIAPSDLATLIDDALGKGDAEAQLRIGAFLHYDAQGNARSAELRLERSGKEGAEFNERIPGGTIHVAEGEIRRTNAGAGLLLVEEVVAKHGGSAAAAKAKELSEEVYKSVVWTPVGSRKWDIADGVYTAAPGKAAGSVLQSPREYENFEVRLEWKVTGALGQGGVYFRWTGRGTPGTANAFKVHLANDAGQGKDMFSTGALFKVESPDVNAGHAEGKWNTLNLRVHGEKVRAVINGKTVLDTTATSRRIPLSGFVCLDGEVGGIAYRKTLLIELPAPKKPKPAAATEKKVDTNDGGG